MQFSSLRNRCSRGLAVAVALSIPPSSACLDSEDQTNALASNTRTGSTPPKGDGLALTDSPDTENDLPVQFSVPIQGYSATGGTLGFKLSADGYSWIDTINSGVYGAGNGQTLAIGWTGGGGLLGNIDSRDNHNTHCSTTSAGYFEESSGYDMTNADYAAYGIRVVNIGGRIAGNHSLTDYGVYVDTTNGQTNYAVYAERGDVFVNSGNLVVNTGSATVGGHVKTSGPSVTFIDCGISPICNSSSCTDVAGTFTTGTDARSCTITFTSTYGRADDADCIVVPIGTSSYPTISDGTPKTLVLSTVNPSSKYKYVCIGH